MATNGLQPMPMFEPKSDPTNTSACWTQWMEIFKTLSDTGDEKDYDQAVCALESQSTTVVAFSKWRHFSKK